MLRKIAWKNIVYKPLNTALCVSLLLFGVGIISLLLLIQHQLEQKFDRDLQDIDLVVGAKGSPLQLVLSAVYHLDAPTGNIKLADARKIMEAPMVQEAIPLAYGDSYRGHRILGTTEGYLKKYDGQFREGRLFAKAMEATIGNDVAEKTGLQMGDTFLGTHGEVQGGHVHDEHPYTVVGILEKTNSVLDQLVLTNVESVWAVHNHAGHEHEDEDDHDHDDGHDHDHDDGHDHDHDDGHDHDHDDGHDHDHEDGHDHDHDDGHDHDHDDGHDHDHEDGHDHDHEDGHDHDHEDGHDHDHEDGHDHDHEDGHDHDHEDGHDHDHEDGHDHDHEDGHDHDHEDGHDHDHALSAIEADSMDITAILLQYKSKMAVLNMPRIINEQTNMQAVLPALEINRLFYMLGIGATTLKLIAAGIMIMAGFSVFFVLFNRLRERKFELALMRTVGYRPWQLFGLLVLEGLLLAIVGYVLGWLLSRAGLYVVNQQAEGDFNFQFSGAWIEGEAWLLLLTLLVGVGAALLPAWQAMQMNISDVMSEN